MLEAVGRAIRSLADEVRPTAHGWVARTPSLPQVWSLNEVRIVEPVSFSEAVAITDEEQGGLSFRHLVIEDDATGRELEDAFASAGWAVDREVYMVLGDAPLARVDARKIVPLTEDQALSLIRAWGAERHPSASVDSLDQLGEYSRREGRFWAERSYGVVDERGSPLAMTKLRLDDGFSWVEDVFTMPAARRRGLARTLVTHVTRLAQEANRPFTFIAADDNDWPKHLYASVGFRPVACTWTFHRSL